MFIILTVKCNLRLGFTILAGHLRLFIALMVNFVRLIDVNSMKHNKVIGMSNDVCSGK